MKKRKTLKVTIEKERLLFVARCRRRLEGWCEGCRAEVKMLRVEEAALLAGVSQRFVFRWIESGYIHFAETADGALLVCLDSLLAEARRAGQ